MNDRCFTFGEMLWDCLPSGRHAGGAPFNVAAHLAQLGFAASLISCVGRDALGGEILKVARDKKVGTQFVSQARAGLATGTVIVTLDGHSNATYELVQPAAWDEIEVTEEALSAVERGVALVYGSLACRSPGNRVQLNRLLSLHGPVKFFDVNLRPPFCDRDLVMGLAKRADVIKLNDIELGRMRAWLRDDAPRPEEPPSLEKIAEECAILAGATGAARICVTRAELGAALWEKGSLISAIAPETVVKDTVGAGDAFMAGLVAGLSLGLEPGAVLRGACQAGAYVASHDGATPLLPPVLTAQFSPGGSAKTIDG